MSRATQHPAKHEREAARRYLEHDYTSEHLSGKARDQANRHAQAIDEEHPRARDIALTGTARELGELPAHLRRHQIEARKRAGITAEDAQQIRHEYRRPPAEEEDADTPRTFRSRATDTARTAAGGAGSLATSAASAATDSSWGSLIGEMILTGMGLSIFYLFLTRARAASELVTGATNVVRAVVSPAVDPLNPKGAL